MNDFKRMSDEELAKYMVEYINRTERLSQTVSDYIQGKTGKGSMECIRAEYKALKQSIKDDAHYVNLIGNRTYTGSLYDAYFVPSISEAAAEGFSSAVNGRIDNRFVSSIYDAIYKLTKYYSLEEWENIAYR